MPTDLIILSILFINIAISEWLVKHTFFRHFGTALLVIIVTAIVSNLGWIPSASNSTQLYDIIFSTVAPMAIFFLLLEVNLESIKKAGFPILFMFIAGSLGTVLGVIVGGAVAGGSEQLGSNFPQLAGMFTGTYTGGSINFNAIALEYDMNKEGNLYAGSIAIDNILTAIWMVATIALPKILMRYYPRTKNEQSKKATKSISTDDEESTNPMAISLLLILGILSLVTSTFMANQLGDDGINIPSILILTTIALVLAQFKTIQQLKGSRIMGIIGIYLFLAVIGAYCEFATLPQLGELAISLGLFVTTIVVIHGLVTYAIGALFKVDWDIVSIASQANIGGQGSALALARSLNRNDLFLPAILVGSLGNALGTYLGFLMVGLMQ